MEEEEKTLADRVRSLAEDKFEAKEETRVDSVSTEQEAAKVQSQATASSSVEPVPVKPVSTAFPRRLPKTDSQNDKESQGPSDLSGWALQGVRALRSIMQGSATKPEGRERKVLEQLQQQHVRARDALATLGNTGALPSRVSWREVLAALQEQVTRRARMSVVYGFVR